MNRQRCLGLLGLLVFLGSLAGILLIEDLGLHKHHPAQADHDCMVCRLLETPAAPALENSSHIAMAPANPQPLAVRPAEVASAAPCLDHRPLRGPPLPSVQTHL